MLEVFLDQRLSPRIQRLDLVASSIPSSYSGDLDHYLNSIENVEYYTSTRNRTSTLELGLNLGKQKREYERAKESFLLLCN